MKSQLLDFLQQRLPKQPTQVAIGFSGGVDSTVLLHLCAQLKSQFSQHQWLAIHVNHGISPKAMEWQQHCQKIAIKLGFEFLTAEHQVVAGARESLEQNARNARYSSFQQLTSDGASIILGQHLQDQTETLLLQLKRGTGIKGLAAMKATSEREQRNYLRPLLSTSRKQIECYAAEHNLSWIEDDSNTDVSFDRNFLRHKILPNLESRWPGFYKATARTARLCAEQAELINDLAAIDYKQVKNDNNRISVEQLNKLSTARQSNLLRFWIESEGFMLPSEAVLNQVTQNIVAAKPDANPVVKWSNCEVRRFKGLLYILAQQQDLTGLELNWDDFSKPLVNDSLIQPLEFVQFAELGVRQPIASESVKVKFQADKSNYQFNHRSHRASVAKLMKELNVPPWMRNTTPMLFYNEQLVAILGLAVVREFVE